MNTKDRIILPITPNTWVRINSGKHGDHILFSMKEICEKGEEEGTPCQEYVDSLRQRRRAGVKVMEGYCKHTLSEAGRVRKWAIERYNNYRIELFYLAKLAGFQLPVCGMSVYFHFPLKKRLKKGEAEKLHGQLHIQRPDTSNLTKAFEDALSTTDEQIAQYSGLGKFVFVHSMLSEEMQKIVKPGEGYVEILLNQPVYNPYNVELSALNMKISMEDIEESRRKRREQRERKREEKKAGKKDVPVLRHPKPLKLVDQKILFKKKDDRIK